MRWSFLIIQKLSPEYLLPLINIFSQSNDKFFHQDPEWLILTPENRPVLIAFNDSKKIIAYAALEVKPFRTLHISFGPLISNENDAAQLITAMTKWLKKKGWWRLTVQLPITSGDHAGLLLKQLREQVSFRQSERFFNWKSWWLTIDQEPEQLFKSFSRHHQKSIKQSAKHPIIYQPVANEEKALALAELYIEMYRHRKLPVDEIQTRQLFISLNTFIQKHQKGLMIEAILDDQLVGGVVVIFQGSNAYYYSGVTTVNYKRSIPVLYTAFYHVIKHCWKAGITTLDFGGFDSTALPGSQLSNINRFKMGFGGELKDYPGQLVFDLNPFLSRAIENGIIIRNNFRKWRQRK
jgi:hypothetical protein